jgi:hypothetical protein
MSVSYAKRVLALAAGLEASAPDTALPPQEVRAPRDQPVLPHALFAGTRGYLERIAFQINGCYLASCYDACAVMMRRLVEVLIIECFEAHGIGHKIKGQSGDWLFLEELVAATLREGAWTLGRKARAGLGKLKSLGDQSAHSRRYNAQRSYVDDVIIEMRTVAEELLYIAQLRQ